MNGRELLSKVCRKVFRLVRLLVFFLVIAQSCVVQLRGRELPLTGTFRPGEMSALGPKHASMALWYVGGPSRYQEYLGKDVPAVAGNANGNEGTTRISLDRLADVMMSVRSAAVSVPLV